MKIIKLLTTDDQAAFEKNDSEKHVCLYREVATRVGFGRWGQRTFQRACQVSYRSCPKAAELMCGVDVTRSGQSKEGSSNI